VLSGPGAWSFFFLSFSFPSLTVIGVGIKTLVYSWEGMKDHIRVERRQILVSSVV